MVPQIIVPAHASPTPQRSGLAVGIIVGGIVVVAALLLAASVLWINYGTAVFFEMIASGIAACF
jgi:hypothetical protein